MPPPSPTSGSGFGDILTAIKNIVSAINQLSSGYSNVQATQNAPDIASAQLVKSSAGRVGRVVVSTAGSAVGYIYDQSNATTFARILFVIPETVGIYDVNMPAAYGILVKPGTSQVVTVSFS